MNKEELVKTIAEKATKKTGLQVSQNLAKACLDATLSTIVERTKKRDKVALMGFGTFDTADRSARVGRNPQNDEAINIPAKVIPTFKAGKNMKGATSLLKVKKSRKASVAKGQVTPVAKTTKTK